MDRNTPSPARRSPYTRPQCHHETLMCLVGAVPPPSQNLVQPERLWPMPVAQGDASTLNLSVLNESLFEYRERVLTADERSVALPREVTLARRGMLHDMQVIWALRLAGCKVPGPDASEDGSEQGQGVSKDAKDIGDKDAKAADVDDDALTSFTVPFKMNVTLPLRAKLRYPVPAKTEVYLGCECKTRANKCRYCDDDAVFNFVFNNLI